MNAIEWMKDLYDKADEASQGVWECVESAHSTNGRLQLHLPNGAVFFNGHMDVFQVNKDATFIATANPATVKRLIEMVLLLAEHAACDETNGVDEVLQRELVEKVFDDTDRT